ncbi:MarR family winged helix-turn-helix transcriptional regulator [Rhodococcus sp. (in: high G+C Gram-positive bacteria)]|uniref:MarR family winged helix-turn-helix transcriptional regulator n=1 Tax=Rhodococcus sp. TaxID=1831 RepID=UPI0025D87A0A|nr:MarR family winged helix-turn-helix transcriptional regulator [Rhodococcus sp. (in: high G+C Gram-positive bacteria)]
MTDTDIRADEDGGSVPPGPGGAVEPGPGGAVEPGPGGAVEPGPGAEVAADPVVALEHEMIAVVRRFRRLIAERARAVHPKLDPVCYPMLLMLRRADAVAMSDLLAELAIEKSTLTRRIDSAARLGLVERIPDPDDARARLVALDPDCRRKLDEILGDETELWRQRLSGWEAADIRELTVLLHRLGESMD